MKKILLMSALTVAAFGAANAQTAAATTATTQTTTSQQAPMVRAKATTAQLTKVVSLQGEQFSKVHAIYTEYYTKLDGLGANPTAAQKADLDKTLATSLQGVLTPAQQKLWKENAGK